MANDRESRREAYMKKLRDPRWQKKRLKILERDGFTCRFCSATEETLHIHHLYYEWGKNPWEYPDDALLTLCEGCHDNESDRRAAESTLIAALRRRGYSIYNIEDMADLFKDVSLVQFTKKDGSWKLVGCDADFNDEEGSED